MPQGTISSQRIFNTVVKNL